MYPHSVPLLPIFPPCTALGLPLSGSGSGHGSGSGQNSGHGGNNNYHGSFSPLNSHLSSSTGGGGGGFGNSNYDLLTSFAGSSSSGGERGVMGERGMGVNNSNMGSQSMHMNAHSMLLSLDHSGGSGSNRASAGSANGRYNR